jgi:hypothetical protein
MDAVQIDNAYVPFPESVNMNIARERPSHRVLKFLTVKGESERHVVRINEGLADLWNS